MSPSTLIFRVNGRLIEEREVNPEVTLLKYLRNKLLLTGTKLGCGEGGCGACTVLVSSLHDKNYVSVNACLFPLPAVHLRAVITVEGVKGHPIQEKMTELHGSQCGFCTPGFIMSMVNSPKADPVDNDLEDILAGNLCRCTGYRPIIDSYNAISTFPLMKVGEKERFEINEKVYVFKGPEVTWYTPTTLDEFLKLKREYSKDQTVIVKGNSEVGIYMKSQNLNPKIIIFPYFIRELHCIREEANELVLGCNVTLQNFADYIKAHLLNNVGFQAIDKMLKWFAGRQIRSVATVSGNLANASPISDLIPIFCVLGTKVKLRAWEKEDRIFQLRDFIVGYKKTQLRDDEIIGEIIIPKIESQATVNAYKQAKRRDDDIAIVNFAIKYYKFNLSIAIGGVDSKVFLYDREGVEKVDIEQIYSEIISRLHLNSSSPGGMPEYRLDLIKGFLTKFFKKIPDNSDNGDEGFKFKICPSVGSLMPHVSGKLHCTGEAQYLDDIPPLYGEYYAVPLLSKMAHAKITAITIPPHLSKVVQLVTEDDVPGSNIIGPIRQDERVFYTKECTSVGQIIALVVAKDQLIAQKASKLIQVTYEPLPFILTIEEAIKQQSFHITRKLENKRKPSGMEESVEELNGSVKIHGQEHFYLETQAGLVIPRDRGEFYEIYASTQNPTEGQHFAAKVLGINQARVECKVKRLGGGFGGKETRASLLIAAASVASFACGNVPIRYMLDRDDDMLFSGHRHTFRGDYKVCFTKEEGRITSLQIELYSNGGHSLDLSQGVLERAIAHIDNGYYIPDFKIMGRVCKTNTPSNTAFRGFGGPQGMFIMESIISHISCHLGIPREQIQHLNMLREGDLLVIGTPVVNCTLREMWKEIMPEYEIEKVKVEQFNKSNENLKRGIALVPTKFGVAFGVRQLNQAGALVHLQRDGSVLISHGGVEMGQGLHTKMAQIAALYLGIPINMIKIKDTTTATVANSSATAASASSDLYGRAVHDACSQLLERLSRVKGEDMIEKINNAYLERIDLSAHGFYKIEPLTGFDWEKGVGQLFSYFTFGVAFSVVQVDLLTGDHTVLQSNLLMDLGTPINAGIDIGQVEGAFIQGLGLFTREELMYSPADGMLITKGPGTYKIPTINDTPRAFTTKLFQSSARRAFNNSEGGVLGSRAVGEPPLFLAASVFFAIKDVVDGVRGKHTRLDSPATPEAVRLAISNAKMLEGERWSIRI